LVGYGGQTLFIHLSMLLITRKDIILITSFLGVAYVPFYAFARILVQNLTFACLAVTQPLRPNLLLHWTRGEKDKAYEVYYTGARYSAFVAGMLTAFLTAYGSDVLRLWVGRRFVEGSFLFRADIVLLLLLFANLPRLLHSISWQFLYATNNQRGLTVLLVCEAGINLILSFLLVKPYGLVGLGIASLVPMVLSHLINVPLLIRRLLGASVKRFLIDGVSKPLAGAVVIFLLGYGMRSMYPVHGWTELVVQGGLLGGLALLYGACIVATQRDRQLLMNKFRRVPFSIRAVTS
jgi:O-antigen/teichoic acid export membrane protein